MTFTSITFTTTPKPERKRTLNEELTEAALQAVQKAVAPIVLAKLAPLFEEVKSLKSVTIHTVQEYDDEQHQTQSLSESLVTFILDGDRRLLWSGGCFLRHEDELREMYSDEWGGPDADILVPQGLVSAASEHLDPFLRDIDDETLEYVFGVDGTITITKDSVEIVGNRPESNGW